MVDCDIMSINAGGSEVECKKDGTVKWQYAMRCGCCWECIVNASTVVGFGCREPGCNVPLYAVGNA